ncbi:MAG: hypothetical protein ABIZ05_07035 [Pseudonocardiaceae bacterium]
MRGPLAPLERAPVSVRAPFVAFPGGRYRRELAPERRAALLTALEGVELGAYDEQVLEWLAGQGVPVVAVVVSLLLRVRKAAAHQARRGGGGFR